MEFNGYVEGMSELQAAPDSTHAAADLVSLEARKVFLHSLMKTTNHS